MPTCAPMQTNATMVKGMVSHVVADVKLLMSHMRFTMKMATPKSMHSMDDQKNTRVPMLRDDAKKYKAQDSMPVAATAMLRIMVTPEDTVGCVVIALEGYRVNGHTGVPKLHAHTAVEECGDQHQYGKQKTDAGNCLLPLKTLFERLGRRLGSSVGKCLCNGCTASTVTFLVYHITSCHSNVPHTVCSLGASLFLPKYLPKRLVDSSLAVDVDAVAAVLGP